MSLNNTLNLQQIEGGEKIKQADKGSYLSFLLTDTKRNTIDNLNGLSASVVLYDKYNNRKWSISSIVRDSTVRFKLPGNLAVGVYDLDITVSNMVFPSDRSVKIEIVEGSLSTSGGASATEPIFELTGYARLEDLDNKVNKVAGKGLSTNDFTNDYKEKLDALSTSGSDVDLSGYVLKSDYDMLKRQVDDLQAKINSGAGTGTGSTTEPTKPSPTISDNSSYPVLSDGNNLYTWTTEQALKMYILYRTTNGNLGLINDVLLKTRLGQELGYRGLSTITSFGSTKAYWIGQDAYNNTSTTAYQSEIDRYLSEVR